MKKIKVIKPDIPKQCFVDCMRIVLDFQEAGYACSRRQAFELWSMLSESWDAGWLNLSVANDVGGIVKMLRPFFTWKTL